MFLMNPQGFIMIVVCTLKNIFALYICGAQNFLMVILFKICMLNHFIRGKNIFSQSALIH
jgi:hypothetical protein